MHEAFGVNPELIAGSNGVFDVFVDDKIVFSKYETGRFPNPGEVVEKLQQ